MNDKVAAAVKAHRQWRRGNKLSRIASTLKQIHEPVDEWPGADMGEVYQVVNPMRRQQVKALLESEGLTADELNDRFGQVISHKALYQLGWHYLSDLTAYPTEDDERDEQDAFNAAIAATFGTGTDVFYRIKAIAKPWDLSNKLDRWGLDNALTNLAVESGRLLDFAAHKPDSKVGIHCRRKADLLTAVIQHYRQMLG